MESSVVEQFLSIGIVGVALSFAIQWLQAKFGVEGSETKAIAIVGSVILGGAIWLLQGTAIWAAIIGVLSAASLVYAMIFSGIRN